MRIPRGDLLRSRVVDSPAEPLRDALDRELTGYLRLEPADALLLDDERTGVVTFEDGIPVLAYEAATDCAGTEALEAVAAPGPYRAELYAVSAASLADAHESADALAVDPTMPADRLTGDADLAERTRRAAPDERLDEADAETPLEAFLADEERIDAIREQAREEARARADEWGLTDQLDAHPSEGGPDAPPSPADPSVDGSESTGHGTPDGTNDR
ncbi:MAG: hypothetical protein ABEH78_07305 [Haloferacaceae archaeon]